MAGKCLQQEWDWVPSFKNSSKRFSQAEQSPTDQRSRYPLRRCSQHRICSCKCTGMYLL